MCALCSVRFTPVLAAATWLLAGIATVAWARPPADQAYGYRCRGQWVSLQRADGEWLITTNAAARLINDGDAAPLLADHPALA